MSRLDVQVAHIREHLRLGCFAQARELVGQVLRDEPSHCDSLYAAGLLALADRDYPRARKFIDGAYAARLWVDDRVMLPHSIELIADVCRADPEWSWAQYQLARERWRWIGAWVKSTVRALRTIAGRPLTFVQVGANDGKSGDPLHDLINGRELQGLLIEPQPEPFAKLREHYAHLDGLAYENAAVTEQPGTVQMLTAVARMTIGSLVPERGLLARHRGETRTVEVAGKTFDMILQEHGIKTFDLLQIDTEGFDYNVLKQVDLERTGVKIINMEYYHLPVVERLAACRLLEAAGFVFTCSYMDLLAIHRDTLGDEFCVTDLLL